MNLRYIKFFILSFLFGCSLFKGNVQKTPTLDIGAGAKFKILIREIRDNKDIEISVPENELKEIAESFENHSFKINNNDFDYTLTIIHKYGEPRYAWRTLSFFTLGIIPYWENATHFIEVKDNAGKVYAKNTLETTSVISIVLLPMQVIEAIKKDKPIREIRKLLIDSVINRFTEVGKTD